MTKTSETKGFDDFEDLEIYIFVGRGGAGHHTADAAQANNQGVIIRQQGVWGGKLASQKATHDRD